jgi:hypothetical protein
VCFSYPQTPTDWGMTSGTTGSSKYFPILPLNTERTLFSTGKPASQTHLRKFPLQRYKHPTYSTSAGPSSSVQDTEAPAEGSAQQEWRHRTLSMGLAGPCEELPGDCKSPAYSDLLFFIGCLLQDGAHRLPICCADCLI